MRRTEQWICLGSILFVFFFKIYAAVCEHSHVIKEGERVYT